MELRKAADVLLRSQTSPLSSLLNPSASRWAASTQFCHRNAFNRHAQRALTNSTRDNAIKPQATTSATPSPTQDANSTPDDLVELSNSLWARPKASRLTLEEEKRMNNGDSASDIMKTITEVSSLNRGKGIDTSAMLNPSSPLHHNKLGMSDVYKYITSAPLTRRIPMRLNPSTGRSIDIDIGRGIDVARGLRLLEQSCGRNRVRADFTAQRFHERGGLKRKRLRRQRWRKKFMEGFRTTVGRVKQLKQQGW